MCRSELRGLGAINESLKKKNGSLYAVSVDSPAQNKDVVQDEQLGFGILSDEKLSLVKQLGLVHEEGGPTGQSIARPAHLLINKDGTIAWRYISLKMTERPLPAAVLTAIESID